MIKGFVYISISLLTNDMLLRGVTIRGVLEGWKPTTPSRQHQPTRWREAVGSPWSCLILSLPLWLAEQGRCLLLYLAEHWLEKLIQESEVTAEFFNSCHPAAHVYMVSLTLETCYPHPAIPGATFSFYFQTVAFKSPSQMLLIKVLHSWLRLPHKCRDFQLVACFPPRGWTDLKMLLWLL